MKKVLYTSGPDGLIISQNKQMINNYIYQAPIRTAADDLFFDIFSIFEKNKVGYYMRIVCQQTMLTKHHALLLFSEKAAKFMIVGCCKL